MQRELVAGHERKDLKALASAGAAAEAGGATHDLYREGKLRQQEMPLRERARSPVTAVHEDLTPRLRKRLHEENHGDEGRRASFTGRRFEQKQRRGIVLATLLQVLAPGSESGTHGIHCTHGGSFEDMLTAHILLRGMAPEHRLATCTRQGRSARHTMANAYIIRSTCPRSFP